MITDTEARKIASDWHGGGGTALYAFSSTGAINTARADHDIMAEIKDCLCGTFVHRSGLHNFERPRLDLNDIATYVHKHGTRGPVEGWSKLTW